MKAKRGGGGHHGGSWKVALADFAIAMMALFLLLWIMNATDDDTKSAIAAYFEDPGAFRHKSSLNPIDFGGQDSLVRIPNPGPSMRGREGPEIIGDGNAETLNESPDFKDLMDELQRMIGGDDSAGKYEDFIYLEQLQEGLRIVILDNDQRNMFERGSSRMNPFFQDLLLELAPIINNIDNRLMISGHTDSSGFQRSDYGNWELSAARAQVARKTLLFGGLFEEKVLMVLGMADRVLRDPKHPESSANRRIEIMVLADYMERQVERMFAPIDEEDHEHHPTHSNEMHDAFERAERNQFDYPGF
ncbi:MULTISPECIES: flagellar motor protein MotB [Gammaproteobacteria]|uniref:flagellar motor protein MotB n=1 Tax=Gammaproteobacteria TaxID=1236 RepID=UPI001ADA54AA|nr:OmpA family protein [Salinisphaera sp. G21_0]MBO9495216.1 OmpA family protein [Thalassotalea sp. G20_0]